MNFKAFTTQNDTLDEAMTKVDKLRYIAKESGRNWERWLWQVYGCCEVLV